jgi:hypothetical protein
VERWLHTQTGWTCYGEALSVLIDLGAQDNVMDDVTYARLDNVFSTNSLFVKPSVRDIVHDVVLSAQVNEHGQCLAVDYHRGPWTVVAVYVDHEEVGCRLQIKLGLSCGLSF